MTTSTAHRQSHQTSRNHVDTVVQDVVHVVIEASSDCQETHRGQPPLLRIVVRQLIGR